VSESGEPEETDEERARQQSSRRIGRALWGYAAARSWHGFIRHRGLDSAASLAYFSALALFPGALTIVSLFALADNREKAQRDLLDIVNSVANADAVEALKGPIGQLLSIPNPGIALGIGLVFLLWTTSSYVTAFGRAVNTAYEVQEGRQIWKFRGLMLIVALVLMLVFSAIVALLLATPSVVDAVAQTFQLSDAVVVACDILRWPVLAVLCLLAIALLYFYSPNVRHLRIRWVSWGALFAVVVWAIATVGFALYVLNVAQYNRIYGWLGGGIVALLWLYITNFVLVFGAEVDSEIVRARQLQDGVAAEEVIQLPMRDTTRNLVLARQLAEDVRRGREFREAADQSTTFDRNPSISPDHPA